MISKEQYLEMHKRLLALAESHNAEYIDKWFVIDEEGDGPFFSYSKCNIPLLADVRMLAEEYDLRGAVESSDSWGYVALDFTCYRFKDQEEADSFRQMIKELAEETIKCYCLNNNGIQHCPLTTDPKDLENTFNYRVHGESIDEVEIDKSFVCEGERKEYCNNCPFK